MVNIKQYTREGSATTCHAVQEAEEILRQARLNGGFVYHEGTSTVVRDREPLQESETYTIIPRIVGG